MSFVQPYRKLTFLKGHDFLGWKYDSVGREYVGSWEYVFLGFGFEVLGVPDALSLLGGGLCNNRVSGR